MFRIEEATLTDMRAAMKKGALSARQLALAYIGRIAEYDSCEGGLNSVLEVNPDALFIAEALDREREAGETRGPLHGMPVLVKDNINTADKMHTSAGSLALADCFAPYDAHIVKLLRRAGAVILGKANMTEFANYMADRMPGGYSSRGGQVLCPYNRSVNPSGSSSGSAVSAAASLCAVSVGTETSGSILAPAQRNGVVGIKPTMGLISRTGIVPIANTLDTAGPMARTVRDAAILLGILAGEDADDPATAAFGGERTGDYTQFLDADGLKGARIGINMAKFGELSEEEQAAFHAVKKKLSDAGAVPVEMPDIEPVKNVLTVMRHEFRLCMNAYLASLGERAPVKSLTDIVRFNEAHAGAALKYGQARMLDAESAVPGRLANPEYRDAFQEREDTMKLVGRVFDGKRLDAMLFAAGYTNVAPFIGYPAMTVPSGIKRDGTPLGSYWMARRYDEKTLLRVAYAFEQTAKARKAPEL